MKFLKGLTFLLVFSLIICSASLVIAQDDDSSSKDEEKPVAEKKVEDKANDEKGKKADKCECGKEADEAILKAYDSVEEDDWVDAIGVVKKATSTISGLEDSCKCIDVESYEKIALAFRKYAEGGQLLDESDEIDCDKANKLYGEAVSLISGALPKIKSEDVKEYSSDVKDYCEEEMDFIADECE